jgi:threonine synthase
MGLPVESFIAATNANDVFPKYLQSGVFKAKPSKQTISNAMDVGKPSNLDRIKKFIIAV